MSISERANHSSTGQTAPAEGVHIPSYFGQTIVERVNGIIRCFKQEISLIVDGDLMAVFIFDKGNSFIEIGIRIFVSGGVITTWPCGFLNPQRPFSR